MRVSICARKTQIWDPTRAFLRWTFPKSSIDKHLRTWHRMLQYNALQMLTPPPCHGTIGV